MTNYSFETVDVPAGAYIGWGTKPGQHVTGKVLDYSPAGGTNFAGDPCPQLSVELVDKAASFNKEGERRDYDPGELVVLNAGQANLKRGITAAQPARGDVIKITLDELQKTANGTVKVFKIQIARGAAAASTPAPPAAPTDSWSAAQDEEAPF